MNVPKYRKPEEKQNQGSGLNRVDERNTNVQSTLRREGCSYAQATLTNKSIWVPKD